MENKATTEWTSAGYRVTAEMMPAGSFILTCHSHVLTAKKDAPPERVVWIMSQLGIPLGTARGDAARLVAYWLAFYGDEDLSRLGLAAFAKVFDAVPEQQATVEPASAGQPGSLN